MAKTQHSDRHRADITRDHARSAGRGECSSQIDIVETSNNITYNLQQGENEAVRLTFWKYQTTSLTFCRSGKNAAVRSTLWRYQKRSRTVCRRTKQSDRHSADIKRDHILPAGGGECSNQINIVELSEEITYDLQEAGEHSSQIDILEVSNVITYNLQDGKYAAIRSTFRRYQTQSRTVCRSGENTAVRMTLRKHNERSCTVCRR